MADLNDYQNYMREQRRQADKNIVDQVGSIRSRSALYEFALSVALPNVMSDLDSSKLYAVAKMTDPDVWQDFLTSEGSEEHLMAISVVSKRGMEWCGQLLQLEWGWSMHGDGKHKLSLDKWLLLTFGTHCLTWDNNHKEYRHSFRPLIYVFKQGPGEPIEAIRYGMVSLQVACKQMHGEFLTSAVNISDHSDAMKKGLDFLNVRGFGLGAAALSALGIPVPDEDEDHQPTLHLDDWAHMAVKFMQGKLGMSKSHPYHGELYHYLNAVHLAHSAEMQAFLVRLLKDLMKTWEEEEEVTAHQQAPALEHAPAFFCIYTHRNAYKMHYMHNIASRSINAHRLHLTA